MKEIEEKVLKDGIVLNDDILKVDSFLNHQIDVLTLREFARGVKEFLHGQKVDQVLTIETSGIAVAYAVAEELGDVPILFAKKSKSKIVDENVYRGEVVSFTRGIRSEITVSKKYLKPNTNVLIVDDFLASGNAGLALIDLANQAGAKVIGMTAVIEKLFQGGRERIEALGVPVFAGASIKAFLNDKPVF